MKLRILLLAVVGSLVCAGAAAAHPQPGGFTFTLNGDLFAPDDGKAEALRQAALRNARQPARAVRAARCRAGTARGFPCENVHLLSNLSLEQLGGGDAGNDMWGWIDPRSDREYALMGKTNGTAFVDITDPREPRLVAHLPTQVDGPRNSWRDIKVYRNHAYVVSEHIGHGMQVFDLRRLRDIRRADEPVTVEADAVYDDVSNTHNLDINTESGYAYLVGTNTCGYGLETGGLHIVDIRRPKRPVFAGCGYAEAPATPNNNYVHDVQCVNYDGPDTRYAGREICFGSNENAVVIYDVTNKQDTRVISQTIYDEASYTHQGWLTADSRWFVFNDELDELFDLQSLQTTYMTNVEDLEDPTDVMSSPNNTTSTDHNLYIKDDVIYESNYTSGLRLFDTSGVPDGDLEEIGFFDVYPENDNPGFEGGTWSNYAWYGDESIVAVSTIDRGLFILETDVD
jgi:choice-of-anchor B domain-containing protein